MWQGENLGDKTLLVLSLNSYGDIFERTRHLNKLSQLGINWKLVTKVEAIPVLRCIFPSERLFSYSDPTSAFDVWAHLNDGSKILSLGRVNQTKLSVPEVYQTRFSSLPKPSVGLCFQAGEKYSFPKFRSIGLVGAEKIVSSVHNVNWVCLQYGQKLSSPCLNPKLESWMDTAGIIANLDAVVTADTAILHLSALLRKSTIVLFGTAPTSVTNYKNFASIYPESSIKQIQPTYGGFEGGQPAWKKFIEWANKTPEWWKPENF